MTFSVSAPTNNTGALLNNGTEVLSVSSNNYIGIGTSTPSADLEIGTSTTTPEVKINLASAGGYISFKNNSASPANPLLELQRWSGSSSLYYGSQIEQANRDLIFSNVSTAAEIGSQTFTEQMRIDSNGYVTKPNQVSFFARGVATTAWSSYTADGDPLIFDAVISNQGNAYNSSTGTFTAPVTGTYIFNVHLRFDNLRDTTHDYYHPFWKVNGSANWNGAILRLITSAPTTKQYMSLHESINLYLAENDTVQFAHGDSNSITNANTTAFNGSQCRFSGYLLG